ncbi:hypothetical protein DFH07DRAFT_543014 [Mycena maculata]|uniref:Uncharacterized protein n=1 Tax=Mycena maculata TaxID=230809 RepID=A0AAD7N965_9AGAR|nr:hypothetical protein DFH07DRAFT_543014 [Mycena maculata]
MPYKGQTVTDLESRMLTLSPGAVEARVEVEIRNLPIREPDPDASPHFLSPMEFLSYSISSHCVSRGSRPGTLDFFSGCDSSSRRRYTKWSILSRIFSQTGLDLLGFITPLRTITLNSVLLTQTDPQPRNGTDIAMLRLIPRTDWGFTWPVPPSRVVEDFSNASMLGGLAQLGGFWTTTNGAFAMFFGANLLYFLFSEYRIVFFKRG